MTKNMNLLVVLFNLRAPVGGETEWVEKERHVVMLGRILDLSTRLVDTKSATMMVVLLVGGEERDRNDNGITVVVVTRINLKDDFHKWVESVLLLFPDQTCMYPSSYH